MKIKSILFILLIQISLNAFAQNPVFKIGQKLNAHSFDFSVFNNQYYFPFLGIKNLVGSKYHPGLAFGYTRNLKVKKKSIFYLDAKLGVYHHRFIQTGIQLYGDIGYRFLLPRNFDISTDITLGYLHAILHQTSFKADGDGNYKKVKNYGKSQFMTGIGIGVGKQIHSSSGTMRVFIKYQPWFQMPFIKSYVPLLPNNSMHLGVNFNISK
jgi:hypothetical protein